ncbi:STAS/SEC14 domain-containing protein [Litorivicinus lipolyticus]|uniref:STAS/SEC14 domain-containing protein n=1 Tax=Litorivicinus lipolyticus TaxID=418701 RepID=UPI003B5AE99F
MIEVKRNGKRVELVVEGPINLAAMQDFIPRALIATEGLKHGSMLMHLRDGAWPTIAAMGLELVELPKMIRLIRRFDRIAVMTDRDWIGELAEFEGLLIPGLKIEAFDLDELAEASAWLKEPLPA